MRAPRCVTPWGCPVTDRDRIAALEAECARLRRERADARNALQRALGAIPLHMRELRVRVATAAGLMEPPSEVLR